MDDEPGNADTEPDGLTSRLSRMAFGPARAAARSGREALTGEAERAIDGVLAGPMPETVARAIVEHHVVERVLAEWLEAVARGEVESTPERERLLRALEEALASPAVEQGLEDVVGSRLTETVTTRVIRSPAFSRALAEVLQSPEVRSVLMQQTQGFGSEIAEALRSRTTRVDDNVEVRVHRAFGMTAAGTSSFGGLATRALGLVVDGALALVAYLVAAGSVALVVSLAGSLRHGWLTGSLFGAGWMLVVAAYFVFFWSTAGQTPGMRLMGVRVVTGAGRAPGALRSIVRFVGLALSIALVFLGFVPVLFDRRRRALQDYLAGTAVVLTNS
jgi:uncharacterized RDD family membrane protein YckC